MSALLGLALIAGIVVWYLYQDLARTERELYVEVNDTADPPETTPSVAETASATPSSGVEAPRVITADSLSEEQRALLASFGLEGASVTITDAMLTCANESIGEKRLGEIVNGSAPSPLEAMKLLPCLKK